MHWALLGDPHSKPVNREPILSLFQIVEKMGLPLNVWLGDLLDNKEVIRGKCLNDYYHYFRDSKLKHVVLVGNHDWFSLECKEHSLELLKELPNVTVVDRPTKIDDALFLPYYHDLSAFRKAIEEDDSRILIMHQGVNGFDFGNGFIEDKGLELTEIGKYELVVSGHFHKFQRKGNLLYPGTPFTHSFGESDQEKFIATLDPVSLKMEFIKTPFPAHVTIHLKLKDPTTDYPAHLAKRIAKDSKKGDFVRAILEGTEEALLRFDRTGFENIKIIERLVQSDVEGPEVTEASTNAEQFVLWANLKGLSEDVLELGFEILEGASK